MTRADLDALHRLRALTGLAEPKLREQLEQALRSMRGSVSVAELERILARRDAVALHDLMTALPARLRPAARTLEETFVKARVIGAAQARAHGAVAMDFRAVDADVVQAARADAALMVTRVTNETRKAIRQIVERAVSEGLAPREAAKLIQPLIGLNAPQAKAVASFRKELIERGVSRATATARAEVYATRLLKRRAETIARTEIIGASTRGQLSAWTRLQSRGLLVGARKRWMTTPDDWLCRYCRPLNGQTVPLGGVFRGIRGAVAGPPLHPSCRCAIALVPAAASRTVPRAA